MSTSMYRQARKEEQKHHKIVSKLCEPLSTKIADFKFIGSKARCQVPCEFEKLVEIANAQYNSWATNFNKKSKHYKAKFNGVRDLIATEIAEYELNTYKDLIIEGLNLQYGIMAHQVEDANSDIEKIYVEAIPVAEAVVFIKSKIKK